MKAIICHAFPAWDAPYVKSTVELMTRLTKDHRVIYLDYHYTWKDVFKTEYCPKEHVLGLKSRWRKIKTDHGMIEVYNTPPILPMNWVNNQHLFKLLSQLNGWWIRRHVRKVLKKINMEETTLVNTLNPVFGCLTHKAWKVKKKVYYCYDELKGTSWSNKYGPSFESDYLKKVDQVICSSKPLAESKKTTNPNVSIVKNGVNLSLFQRPSKDKTNFRRIGYIGAIDDRIDFKLIHYLAKELPEYQFQFFGPIKSLSLKGLPVNVVFNGPQPQEKLAELLRQVDACIIPFVRNELTAGIYPLKINEYLAMGKPVVSTHFGDLSDFSNLISIAENQEEFLYCLNRELKTNSRFRIQKRIDFASGNSWEERQKNFSKELS